MKNDATTTTSTTVGDEFAVRVTAAEMASIIGDKWIGRATVGGDVQEWTVLGYANDGDGTYYMFVTHA